MSATAKQRATHDRIVAELEAEGFIAPTIPTLTLDIPLAKPLPSLANSRLHWRAMYALKKAQRHRTALYLRARGAEFLREWRKAESARVVVTLTRISPRSLDAHDNLRSAFKVVVDQVADELGLPNDRSPRVEWHYAQERGAPGYRIRLEVLTAREAA